MHHSRLCAVLIDCKTADLDEASHFWAAALGHPMSRDSYRMLATPPDEPIVEIQSVEHESRVHIDIETDDIPAEVRRLERLGATVVDRPERWVVMQARPANASALCGYSARASPRTPTAGIRPRSSSGATPALAWPRQVGKLFHEFSQASFARATSQDRRWTSAFSGRAVVQRTSLQC